MSGAAAALGRNSRVESPLGALRRLRFAFDDDLTLGTVMERLAALHGERTLVTEPERTLTYRQAADLVARLAAGVAAEVRPGDRVVVATPNGYDLLLVCLAVSRAGGVAVPVNPLMRAEEVDHVIADSGAALVVRDAAEVERTTRLPAAPQDPDATAATFYTSGTTGAPKGAMLTSRALLRQAARAAAVPARLFGARESVVALPVAHIMGFLALLGLACAGVPAYVLPRFRAEAVLDAIEGRRATSFVGVPAMYRLLLEAGAEERDLSSVRLWASGADVMPDDLARRFKRMGSTVTLPLLGGRGEAAFAEGYGMVELSGGVAAKLSPPGLGSPLGDFLGVPLPPNRLKVMADDHRQAGLGEVGELWVKGPGVLKGYHNRPEATAAAVTPDGWLRTGDLARRGPFGLVSFAGRNKDVVKHGGYSVFAVEVQEGLEEHPAVAEAAVLGLPDPRKGEVPVAAVRLLPDATATEAELLAWAREHFADYKAPRQVRIVDDLPRTGTGKVQKAQLRPLFTPR